MESFISKPEAAVKAGVSLSTLERFAEAGYLTLVEQGGQSGFRTKELSDVFGIAIESPSASHFTVFEPAPHLKVPSVEPHGCESCHVELDESETTAQPAPTVAAAESSSTGTERIASEQEQREQEQFERLAAQAQAAAANPYVPPSAQSKTSESASSAPRFNSGLLSMYEGLIARLESEITELKKERDWLRSRVEKLEEKAERDQLLLLSERQLLKSVITSTSNRRSPMQTALEWLGFRTSSGGSGTTLEITQEK